MPELPEVETVKRGLAPVLEGRNIIEAQAFRPDLRWPLPEGFARRIAGAYVTRLSRRAKYVMAELSSGESLLLHLGMSGRIRISGPNDPPEPLQKHDHVVFDSDAPARIVFHDPRRFGAMDLVATERLSEHPWIAHLGVEPLSNDLSPAYLFETLKDRKAPMKSLLLDQRIIAGLGNIYVCEALYRAHILPTRQGKDVSEEEVTHLTSAIRDVLNEAIAAGGSSLRDHRQTDGSLGYFQHGFKVYGRENEACKTPKCTGIVSRIVQSGRSSFFCPICQS